MALQDGLYKVEFQTPLGEGAGVVSLRNGVLEGGDSMMFYRGTYVQDGDAFQAQISVGTHTSQPGMGSVLGVPAGTLSLSGDTSAVPAQVTGSSPQAPGLQFGARLSPL